MALSGQVVRFFAQCVWDVTWAFVPGYLSIPYKVAENFYKHFLAAEARTKRFVLDAVNALPDRQVASVADQILAQVSQTLGILLPPDASAGVCDLLLSLQGTARQSPSPADAAEVLRRSLNQRLTSSGDKPIRQRQLSSDQRALGSLLASSMMASNLRAPRPAKRHVTTSIPVIPGYDILRLLGQGGFASVYLARHEATGELRAIKFGSLGDERHIDREMNVLQTVQHPNLVRYFEHGKLHGKYWIAMEYLGEHTLADVLAEVRLDQEQGLLVGEQILEGLAALHQMNVIHRDLKPENVMVDGDFRLRLIDFGLAKTLNADGMKTTGLTVAGDLIGTPQYMSIEQALGEGQLTPGTDIWSFGAVLYEMCAGQTLIQAKTLPGLGRELALMDVEAKLSSLDLMKELRPFLKRCLQRDATSRYPNAQVALQEFQRRSQNGLRRLRHEQNRDKWVPILKAKLLEKFAEKYRGQMPAYVIDAFKAHCHYHGVEPEVDEDRLLEILPPIFTAQAKVERTKKELAAEKQRLQEEIAQVTSRQIDSRNQHIRCLEDKIKEGQRAVTAETRRQLTDEVATWQKREHQEAERRKKEQRRQDEEQRWQDEEQERRRNNVGTLGTTVGAIVLVLGGVVLGGMVLGGVRSGAHPLFAIFTCLYGATLFLLGCVWALVQLIYFQPLWSSLVLIAGGSGIFVLGIVLSCAGLVGAN